MPTIEHKSKTRKRVLASILISSINLILVWSLAPQVQSQDQPKKSQCSVPPKLPQAYWKAVEDAKKSPDSSKVFRNLTAITHDNNGLVWDKSGRVLVVTWAHYNYSQVDQILHQDLWVTVVPDLQKFCKNYTSHTLIEDCHLTPLECRIDQLLGMPFDAPNKSRQIVEIWVDPKFLFRPSPDPEITDHEAELNFRPPNEFASVSFSYYQWFKSQFADRYEYQGKSITPEVVATSCKVPYPWSRLGYTYDWGNSEDWQDPNRPKTVGLSEFVIRQGSPISVKPQKTAGSTQITAEQYCRPMK